MPICPICKKEFTPGPRSHNQKTHPGECSAELHRRKCREANERRKLPRLALVINNRDYGIREKVLQDAYANATPERQKEMRQWHKNYPIKWKG